jgi:hypothetical protein
LNSALVIYLDLDLHQDSIDLPTSEFFSKEKISNEQLFARGLFDLSTHKVCHALFITAEAVGSYPTFSPFPLGQHKRSLFRTNGGLFSVALAVP